jgi:hypothetical protein
MDLLLASSSGRHFWQPLPVYEKRRQAETASDYLHRPTPRLPKFAGKRPGALEVQNNQPQGRS